MLKILRKKKPVMSENQPAVLDFEKKINELEDKIKTLNALAKDSDVDIDRELNRLQQKLEKQIKLSYANLTPWQRVQIARHPGRPQCLDYINGLIEDFVPLAGDRLFADDATMIGGIGRFKGISVVVLGQEKGCDLETRVKYNFGMAKPEGYRKAQRLMDVTKQALHLGIAQAVAGNRVGDIGHAVQSYVEENGFSVVRSFVGHGVGKELHEDPEVPNYGHAGHGVRLVNGMTIAIEPMVNQKHHTVKTLSDGWTVKTCDGGLSAHFEHTVAITPKGPEILTRGWEEAGWTL